MKKICIPLYDALTKEGPPLFSEMGFDFVAYGRRFKGRFDEIRKKDDKIIIRDYKSGRPWVGEMKLEFDPQLTLYNVALCSLLFADAEFAKILGISDEQRKSYMGHPNYTEPNFINQFFMIEALKIRDNSKYQSTTPLEHIYSTSRREEHFREFMSMISGIERAVTYNDIYAERGKKCDDCDMKVSCKAQLEKAGKGEYFDKHGQGILNFASPAYIRPLEETKQIDARAKELEKSQKKLRLRKKKK